MWRLLRIFAFGTYKDYVQQSSELPPLTNEMVRKLRMLTIISMAETRSELSYSELVQALGLDSHVELEDLVISCIYQRLLLGKLAPMSQSIQILDSMSRDIDMNESSLSALQNELDRWSQHLQVLADGTHRLSDIVDQRIRAQQNLDSATLVEQTRLRETVIDPAIEKLAEKRRKDDDPSSDHPMGFSSLSSMIGGGLSSRRSGRH